jgi:uncharacterized protein YjbI with pentapeptide repeats
MVKAVARNAVRGRELHLPHLTAFDGDRVVRRADYDAVDFVDHDFTGQDASDARFLECRLQRCCLDGLSLQRARLVGSLLADVHGASVDLSDSTWRDSHVVGGRLGAMTLVGATLTGVRVRGSKLGFVNLAGARMEDVMFEGCEIGTVDARSAHLRSIGFVDCTLDELNVAGATLAKVDLSGARLRSLVGVESLRGAIVSHQQLIDLAPLLAAQLGLEIRPEEPGDADRRPTRETGGRSSGDADGRPTGVEDDLVADMPTTTPTTAARRGR